MKKIVTILVVLSISFSFGQTAIKKSSLSSGGGIATQGNMSMVYAVGEVAVQENTVGTTHLSEGFIGPDMLANLGVENYEMLSGVSVYPNPTSNFVNIHFENESDYQITLTDVSGKIIYSLNNSNQLQNKISLKNIQRGIYLLVVKDVKLKKYKVIKIIKK